MNFESAKWRRGSLETSETDEVIVVRRRRNRIILIVAAAIVLIAMAFFMFAGGSSDKTEVKVAAGAGAGKGGQAIPAVTVIVPGRQDVPNTISATGSLAARRDMPVGIPGEGGQVVRVFVEPGQWVRAGQTLAIIDRSVQAQEASQLAAQIEVARADARLAQQELERAQSLVSRGFVSKADVERRIATRDSANARVRVAQANLAASRARIGRLDIRAPTAGLVLTRSVEAGQVVGAGSGALFRIAAGGEMEVQARLPQTDLAQLGVGVPATVTPVGSSKSYSGRVWQISPTVDPQTRQGVAKVLVPYNSDLRPGGFAAVNIQAGSITAPLLPESAVLTDDNGTYVMIVDEKNVVQRRPIKVATVTDHGVVVSEGLSGTERVVESAGQFLNPGETIRPQRRKAR
ncbi:MAG TPA: efflux RND transporter periplasmic adaptor subunit [Allosphingosinicella sp.]